MTGSLRVMLQRVGIHPPADNKVTCPDRNPDRSISIVIDILDCLVHPTTVHHGEWRFLVIRKCRCVYKPCNNSGLEGYQVGKGYLYRRRAADWNGTPYYRVWPLEGVNHFDTCSVEIFERCFRPEQD
jgi:hypothetical protein